MSMSTSVWRVWSFRLASVNQVTNARCTSGQPRTGPSSTNHWETKNLSPFGSLTNCRTVGSQPACFSTIGQERDKKSRAEGEHCQIESELANLATAIAT